jgi:23S rRNA pseudouridine2605 synthase
MERLQKVIAQAGICSRRKAEELILDGKVKVNGKVCDVLGTKVSNQDSIEVNGNMISKEEKVYYIMNKPKGKVFNFYSNEFKFGFSIQRLLHFYAA